MSFQRITRRYLITTLLVSLLSIASCGGSSKSENSIVGKWKVIQVTFNGQTMPSNDSTSKTEFEFDDKGVWTLTITGPVANPATGKMEQKTVTEEANYKLLNESSMKVEGGQNLAQPGLYEVKVSGNLLTLQTPSMGTLQCERVQ